MKIIDYCPVCLSRNLEYQPVLIAPFVAFRIFGWAPTNFKWDEKDTDTFIALPICKSMRCLEPDCGFYFSDIRYDDVEMGRLYTGYREEEYVAQRVTFEPNYAELNEELEHETVPYYGVMEEFILKSCPSRPKRVLDWGGGNGINTPIRDAEIHILDICTKPLHYGVLVSEPDPPYDLVVCSNTLEHVSYPRQFLRQIKSVMDKDTLLYLEVPIENQNFKAWHEHINKFTEKSTRKVLELAKLDIVDINLFPPPKHGYEGLLGVMCKLMA